MLLFCVVKFWLCENLISVGLCANGLQWYPFLCFVYLHREFRSNPRYLRQVRIGSVCHDLEFECSEVCCWFSWSLGCSLVIRMSVTLSQDLSIYQDLTLGLGSFWVVLTSSLTTGSPWNASRCTWKVVLSGLLAAWGTCMYVTVVHAFYRAMHFSAKRGIAIACRLSVCLSVCL